MANPTTVRKLKECCASFHACCLEWSSVSRDTLEKSKGVANAAISRRNIGKKPVSTTQPQFQGEADLSSLYEQLQVCVSKMVALVDKMGSLWTNVQAISDLLSQSDHEKPVFHTMLPHQYCECFGALCRAYTEQLAVNQKVVELLLEDMNALGLSRKSAMFYLSVLSQQLCVSGFEVVSTLECMLVDCKLRKQ